MRIQARHLKKFFRYQKRTGKIFWVRATSNRARVGAEAGTLSQGYRVIGFKNSYYRGHDIAWALVTGKWPKRRLDHKDRCRSNNRWSNLRPATKRQNAGNATIAKQNTSGFKGVSWHATRRKWGAYISRYNRTIYLGLYKTPQEAHAAYIAAAKKHFGEFARAS